MRIRKRVKQSLEDFELLWYCLPQRDLELIFHPENEHDRQNLRSATHYAFAFLVLGLWANRDPHAGRLGDAFQQAAFEAGWLTDVNLEISSEKAPSAELISAKIRHKNQRIREIRERLQQDSLSESKRGELKAELQKECSYQSLLFEEALSNPDVDPDTVASLKLDGEELEITSEDVEKEQKAESEGPLLRKSLPILTDIKYATKEEARQMIEEHDMEEE